MKALVKITLIGKTKNFESDIVAGVIADGTLYVPAISKAGKPYMREYNDILKYAELQHDGSYIRLITLPTKKTITVKKGEYETTQEVEYMNTYRIWFTTNIKENVKA